MRLPIPLRRCCCLQRNATIVSPPAFCADRAPMFHAGGLQLPKLAKPAATLPARPPAISRLAPSTKLQQAPSPAVVTNELTESPSDRVSVMNMGTCTKMRRLISARYHFRTYDIFVFLVSSKRTIPSYTHLPSSLCSCFTFMCAALITRWLSLSWLAAQRPLGISHHWLMPRLSQSSEFSFSALATGVV